MNIEYAASFVHSSKWEKVKAGGCLRNWLGAFGREEFTASLAIRLLHFWAVYVKLSLLTEIGMFGSKSNSVGSQYTFPGKTTDCCYNEYWHRHQMKNLERRNPGNGQVVDPAIAGYVPVLMGGAILC